MSFLLQPAHEAGVEECLPLSLTWVVLVSGSLAGFDLLP